MPAARRQKQDSDEMRPEYDFSGGVRGNYAAHFAAARMSWSSHLTSRKRSRRRECHDALRSQLKPAASRGGCPGMILLQGADTSASATTRDRPDRRA